MEEQPILVPYQELPADALEALIEDFVTRDGTDYGEVEASLDQKKEAIYHALKKGVAVISFDPESQSCTILNSQGMPLF